jgi:hypothetical protein
VCGFKKYHFFILLFAFLTSQKAAAQPTTEDADHSTVKSENPSLSPQYWARFGAGATQSRYSQSVPLFEKIEVSDDVLTFNLQAGAWFHRHWGVSTYFSDTQGEFKNTAVTDVQNGNYHFRRTGIELLYRKHPLLEKQRNETFLKFGFHQHDLPFLAPVNPVVLTQKNSRVRTIGVGVEHHRKIQEWWRLESWLRYQYPNTSGITPQLVLDAAVGVVRTFANHWSVSLFWTGEWHDYKYETGYQNIFQSNYDLRIGVEF